MCRFFTVHLSLIILLATSIYSQDPPIKWEEIPIADLKMTTFPDDSNASAVILCDYGESKLDDELNIEYNRYLRVKILNENGYDWGTHSINIYTGDYGDRVDDLEGITYSLDENGKIIKSELDDDEIFEEEVTKNRTKYSFTMPALKPGCIIDIHYKIISESISSMRGWTFQEDEPVLWSEYRMIYPQNISYATVTSGFEPWTINEYKEINHVFKGTAAAYLGTMVSCNYYRWAMKNIPALRKEPYVTTISDYVNKVDVQLAGYAYRQGGVKHILNDWQTLNKELLEDKDFGEKIDIGEVKELTMDITKGLTNPEEKMEVIYNWVTKSIVWSGGNNVFAEYDIGDVIEYKKGNSADITFLLISMLKSAGISCDPVIVSTRANGAVQDLYPIVSQFNYILARVVINNKNFFIDATDPNRTMDLLPVKVLNVTGLVIKPDKPEWITLSTNINNLDQTVVNVNLNIDGTITGNFDERFGEYRSLALRSDIGDKKEIDIIKDIYKPESLGLLIDSVDISDKDSIELPLRVAASFSSSDYSQIGGDLIYFNPNIINRLTDNPFKSKERKFPIDYAYPRSQIIITNIKIPDGYELKEKYINKSLFAGASGTYKREMEIHDNVVQIMIKTDIKQSLIKPKFYQQIKDFYAQIISSQAEMLVFGPKGLESSGQGTNK